MDEQIIKVEDYNRIASILTDTERPIRFALYSLSG